MANQPDSQPIQSFPAVYTPAAKILILGSIPSVKSLEAVAYYANPRNAFWPIMESLFKVQLSNYDDKLALVKQEHIALWDVVSQCVRPGSLDSRIEKDSVTANNISGLLQQAPHINTLFFNGQAAAKLYKKHISSTAQQPERELKLINLPSTSPAHAAMSFADKVQHWQIIKDYL